MSLKDSLVNKKNMKFWKQSVSKRLLPTNPLQDDIYLVSFPKSGNTWLRFLLATSIKLHFDVLREVNFFSIHDIIPDLGVSNKISNKGILGLPNLPRILKSHSSYNPYYHRVLLLVRDPKDVVVSYYHYLNNYGVIDTEKMEISQFIYDKKRGLNAWFKHTESWLHINKTSQIIKIFRYEDLIRDPHNQICQMLDLIGVQPDSDKVSKAIELCSKENMQKSELKHMSHAWGTSKKTSFVRKAKVNKGSELTLEDRNYINDLTRHIMKDLGYSM